MEGRGERGGRGKKGIYIYIYNLPGWPPPVCGSCFLRQHALFLYARAYISAYSQAHFHIHSHLCVRTYTYTSVFTHEGTYTYAHAHLRENANAHSYNAYERACTDRHALWHAWAQPRTHTRTRTWTRMYVHAHVQHTRTSMHAQAHTPRTCTQAHARRHMHACARTNAHACIRTRTSEHTCTKRTPSCNHTHIFLLRASRLGSYSSAVSCV